MSLSSLIYRGSTKHKDRPGHGAKGTLCPEWTHNTSNRRLGTDPCDHPWSDTEAHRLLAESHVDPEGSEKRYATAKGMAFVAQNTRDGTWHGYPEPWNKVPAALKDEWLDSGRVTPRQLRQYSDFPRDRIRWALESDDE